PGIIAMIMFPLTLLNIIYAFMTIFFDYFLYMWFVIPAIILNILFGVWFVRYYQAKSSKDSALMWGISSVMLPTLIHLFVSTYLFRLTHVLVIIFPFPLQFLAGLAILRKIEGPEVISPWSGMRLDLSWWKWGHPTKKSDWDPLSATKKSQGSEDWLEE
ncbi:MAG: hypothetical protein ACFFF9_03715, partial [Candidatus Thorarchaeota archaeon]